MSAERSLLPLEEDLRAGRIKHALLCHVHDRWYLGELFCHASWVECLRSAGIPCSICTNAPYLELFDDQPGIAHLYPPEQLDAALLESFDLIIFASTHPPRELPATVPLAIYAWNEGLAVARHGNVEVEIARLEPNLFAATCHRRGQTALPSGAYYRLQLTAAERSKASDWMDSLADGAHDPIVVFNPTASNAHTRASSRPKAVDNRLDPADGEKLITQMLAQLPAHRVMIAAPLKPDDHENHATLIGLGERFSGEPRVLAPMKEIETGAGLSMRAFAALLDEPRVRGMLGNSTGSNAHLAATLGVPTVSIERAADGEMRRNWRAAGRGQMGSFRWRNPHPSAMAVPVRWGSSLSGEQLTRVVRLLRGHLLAQETGWALAHGADDGTASRLACMALDELAAIAAANDCTGADLKRFARLLEPERCAFAYDFADEAEYFDATGRKHAAAVMRALTSIGGDPSTDITPPGPQRLDAHQHPLIAGVLASSNLFKDLCAAARLDASSTAQRLLHDHTSP